MNDTHSIKVTEAAEKLLSNHLFNPTDKTNWLNELLATGLTETEAKQAFKIAAIKYHALRNEQNNKKEKITVGKVAKYTGAGIFTFVVGPWVYLILVMAVIASLGWIFRF